MVHGDILSHHSDGPVEAVGNFSAATGPVLAQNIGHSSSQHEDIVSAILRGQADLAELTMRDHLEGTAALLRGFLG